MRVKFVVSVLLAVIFAAMGVQEAWSQQRDQKTVNIPVSFRYSVKFVCGHSHEPSPCIEYREAGSDTVHWICPDGTVPAGANGAQVVRGLYATAINVHNPGLSIRTDTPGTAVFGKRVAVALPWQKSGPVSKFERAALRPGHAFEIDCEEITKMVMDTFPGGTGTKPPFPIFLKGFLVIMSPAELDVTAVYTSRPGGTGGSSIDVEVIEPRKHETIIQAVIPSG